ncbi:MAG: hypothetical protein AAF479_17270 [Pseudomonadota bacterium]
MFANDSACDVAIFQKAYSEQDISLVSTLADRGVATILDLSDNHWFNPDGREDLTERATRLDRMVASVDLVTVPTEQLKHRVSGNRCSVVDDALEPLSWRYSLPAVRRPLERLILGDRIRLVWFGNPGTPARGFGVVDLGSRMDQLNRFGSKFPIELTAVSKNEEVIRTHTQHAEFPVRYVPWSFEGIAGLLRQHDICVLPINRNAFTECKSPNRLILALRLGLPVVADSIPSYEEFSSFVTLDHWQGGLTAYATRSDVRRQHLRRARAYISARFGRQQLVIQWMSAISEALSPDPVRLSDGDC